MATNKVWPRFCKASSKRFFLECCLKPQKRCRWIQHKPRQLTAEITAMTELTLYMKPSINSSTFSSNAPQTISSTLRSPILCRRTQPHDCIETCRQPPCIWQHGNDELPIVRAMCLVGIQTLPPANNFFIITRFIAHVATRRETETKTVDHEPRWRVLENFFATTGHHGCST